ncbi:MAG: hypothetical protein KDJ80_06085 [Nitratireductor sp.]|nr:hypothetical protein [Nitratireductor sp.]
MKTLPFLQSSELGSLAFGHGCSLGREKLTVLTLRRFSLPYGFGAEDQTPCVQTIPSKQDTLYMAILPAVMDLGAVTLAGYGVLVVLTFAVLFAVLLPYIALAAKARLFFTDPRALRRLNRMAAVAMTGAAGWIVARG